MIIVLAFAAAALINPVQSTFDDMSDDDFAMFVQAHENVRTEHGASIAKGCIKGGLSASPGGFQALCIGCVVGGTTNFASDFVVNDKKEFVMPEGYYYPEGK